MTQLIWLKRQNLLRKKMMMMFIVAMMTFGSHICICRNPMFFTCATLLIFFMWHAPWYITNTGLICWLGTALFWIVLKTNISLHRIALSYAMPFCDFSISPKEVFHSVNKTGGGVGCTRDLTQAAPEPHWNWRDARRTGAAWNTHPWVGTGKDRW